MTAPDGFPLETPDLPVQVAVSAADGFPSAAAWRVGGVSCSPDFAAAVRDLAMRRGTSVQGLAAAAVLLAGRNNGENDPGPGAAVLDIHLSEGSDESAVRKALAVAVALADGGRPLSLRETRRLETKVESLEYRNKALMAAVERLAFRPLDGGLHEVRDAASLFGFVNEWCFDEDRVLRRFRELAPVYHPDTGIVGCRERMAQLIEARNLLVHHVRTAYASGRWQRRR